MGPKIFYTFKVSYSIAGGTYIEYAADELIYDACKCSYVWLLICYGCLTVSLIRCPEKKKKEAHVLGLLASGLGSWTREAITLHATFFTTAWDGRLAAGARNRWSRVRVLTVGRPGCRITILYPGCQIARPYI